MDDIPHTYYANLAEIISATRQSEMLIRIAPEPIYHMQPTPQPTDTVPLFLLVYQYDREVEEGKYAYKFVGGRLEK